MSLRKIMNKLYEEGRNAGIKDQIIETLNQAINTEDRFRIIAKIMQELFIEECKKAGWEYKQRTSRSLLNEQGFFWWENGDHPSVLGGKPCFEVYGASMNSLEKLIKKCKERGLEFDVNATSPYFPGRTIIIRFYRPIDFAP